MSKKLDFLTVAVLLLLSAALSSCVSSRIDADDIDLEVEIAPEGITLPLAVIEKQTLNELLGEKGEIIITHDGYMAVRTADEGTEHSVDGTDIALATVAATAADGDSYFFRDMYLDAIDLSHVIKGINLTEDTVIDMMPPRIILSITNPTPLTIFGDLFLQPEGKDDRVEIPGLVAGPASANEPATSWFYISAPGFSAPSDDRDYEEVHPDNLDILVETLVNTITTALSAGVHSGDPEDVDTNREYTFGASYEVIFPLAFGERMYIPLDLPASEGLGETLRDLADMGIKASELTMNVEFEASFPFRIYDIAAELRTKDEELIPGLDIVIDGLFEGPGPEAADESTTSRLKMTLNVPDGGDFKILSAIDKLYLSLVLSATATGDEYSCFLPDDFIQGRVTVTVADGIIVDLENL